MNPLNHNASSITEAPVSAPHAGLPVPNRQTPPQNLGRWALLLIVLLIAGVIAGLVPRLLHRRGFVAETHELSIPTVEVISAVPGKSTASLTLPAEVKAFVEAPSYARA